MKTLQNTINKSNEAKAIFKFNNIEIADLYLIKVYVDSIEFILCEDDTMAKRVFGGDVTVTGYKNFGSNERAIQMNTGSMGGYDNTCKASVGKVFLQAAALRNWNSFTEVCEALMNAEQAAQNLRLLSE